MRTYPGRVAEVRIDPDGRRSARLQCPPKSVPPPGRYLLASQPADILPAWLFSAGGVQDGFWSAPPVPESWEPGLPLFLRGPIGRGFSLPEGLQRLALVALGSTVERLLPLAQAALQKQAAVALFTGGRLPALPTALEVFPLESIPVAFSWADFLALDLPLESLEEWQELVRVQRDFPAACPGQVLIQAAMPCGGLAECGVCAFKSGRRWKLACLDGPVFDLKDLE